MHKEAQQAASGLTSLGATSEEGAYPQLSSGSNPSVLVDKTKFTRDGFKTTHTDSGENEESRADDISLKVKLEDLSDILKDTRSILFTHDSPPDESIIVSDESEEENEVAKDKDTEATSHDVHLLRSQKEDLEQAKAKAEAEVASMKAKPSYPDINHLTKLLVSSLKPELSKLLASHDFASCLPTEPKELPSKITRLFGEIKELKKHVRDMEIELPGDLKEILKKLETFTSTISSLSSQVAELKNIQWELLAEFLNLPSQVSSVQKKLQTLDSLPSLLNKVTQTLDKFTIVAENASTTTKDVPLAGQATASPAEGEKNTKDADTNLKDELVDLLGKNVVTQYYTKSDKVISNLKVSDLHLTEWREVIQACPDKSGKGWKTIYDLLVSLKLLQRQLFMSLEDWEVSSLHYMQWERVEMVAELVEVT
ncbi:hypothetical protein Tco_0907134 [Tanacetum coccineum]|uniref:Uncharacterized protein n=1 Tax=Tanacetum coccineum TaxID=301880 RepID=A0ABQ5CPL8_9ASTR